MTTHLRIELVKIGVTVDLCAAQLDDLPKHLPLLPEAIGAERDCLQCFRILTGLYLKDLRLMGALLAELAWRNPMQPCPVCHQLGIADKPHTDGCVGPRAESLIRNYGS